ncbi:MAG TPA: thioredoxin family protein [Actinomycetota bacterium]|nr:thioredoxin family protein [Actinomycetota bacterium]
MATVNLTGDSFWDTVRANSIVLVDFWAEWCGPCKRFAPVFERVSEQHPDIVFGKVDTEAEPALSASARILSIPTLFVFREGICLLAQPGAMPEGALTELIDRIRGIDMDDLRRRIAEEDAAPQTPRG